MPLQPLKSLSESSIKISGRNLDLFSYRKTVLSSFSDDGVHEFGPEEWELVQCPDVETCRGFPEKFENSQGWEINSTNHCRNCPANGTDTCGMHHQSPINVERNRAIENNPQELKCFDGHSMAYYDSSCSFDELREKNGFVIDRYALRIVQPLNKADRLNDTFYQIDCHEQKSNRSREYQFGRLDFPEGFSSWWLLSHIDFHVPSEHTQEGKRYSGEIQLYHFYSVSGEVAGVHNEMATVSIFLEVYDDASEWDELNKVICAWREAEEKNRESCGLPSINVAYGSCYNYTRGHTDEFNFNTPYNSSYDETIIKAGVPSASPVENVLVLSTNHTPTEAPVFNYGGDLFAMARPTGTPTTEPTSSPTGTSSGTPTGVPSRTPSGVPFDTPSDSPTETPFGTLSDTPTETPFGKPSGIPSVFPTFEPAGTPSVTPSSSPFGTPSGTPFGTPSDRPAVTPSRTPSTTPAGKPSGIPSGTPVGTPSGTPLGTPSERPAGTPSNTPSVTPADKPSSIPSRNPLGTPSDRPAGTPSGVPSATPAGKPSGIPSRTPLGTPSDRPAYTPSGIPSATPASKPSGIPSRTPLGTPSGPPLGTPSDKPVGTPSGTPSATPASKPSATPSSTPLSAPSGIPLNKPSYTPTSTPLGIPSGTPFSKPSGIPSRTPTVIPSGKPVAEYRNETQTTNTTDNDTNYTVTTGADNATRTEEGGTWVKNENGTAVFVKGIWKEVNGTWIFVKSTTLDTQVEKNTQRKLETIPSVKTGDTSNGVRHLRAGSNINSQKPLYKPATSAHDIITENLQKGGDVGNEYLKIQVGADKKRTMDDFDWNQFISDRYKEEADQKHARKLLNYEHINWFNYFPMRDVKTEYYFRYSGSQTIPPCYGQWIRNDRRQTNHWRVMKDPIRVSERQINELHRLLRERIAPADDPTRSCQKDTAAARDPTDPSKVNVARPLQSKKQAHFQAFCECKNWDSHFEEDQKWCRHHPNITERFYEHPYNFDTVGF